MNAYDLSQSIPKIQQVFDQYRDQLDKFSDWTVEGFVDADPSPNKIYLAWIVNSFVLGGIQRFEDVRSRVKPALEDFMFLQDKLDTGEPGKSWTNERDINNYCGLSGCKKKKFQQGGLETLLNKYSDVLQARQSKIEKNQRIHEDTDVLLDDDQVTVYVPNTKEASCYYGQGTKWCTASTRGENMFEEYNKKGPLYIIVGKDGKKYQMHLQDMQLMDAEDRKSKLSKVVSHYPSLERLQPIKQFELKQAVKENDVRTVKRLVPTVDLSYDDYDVLYFAATKGYSNIVKLIMQNIHTQPPFWFNSDYLLDREDGPAIELANGSKEWWKNGKLHRLDGPAVEKPDGDKEWWKNGKLHRLDGPAVEKADGEKQWFKDGRLHREDGPAVEKVNGDKFWYIDGRLHRLDGPAIEKVNGDKEWYRNAELHREDGPAIEYANGNKEWYRNGKLHREDGPAIEDANGNKEWYRNNKLDREDGPAIEKVNGDKFWYIDDQLHREDGPAIERVNGDKEWYIRGKLDRSDGPAIEKANGTNEWYRNGRRWIQSRSKTHIEN